MVKIGVLGGTFDPIHLGHLGIADSACREIGLERMMFVPAREPWLKGDRDIAPAPHRVEMIKLAILSDPRYDISYVDLERDGPSYTVDTLSDLRRDLGPDADLHFVLGMDAMEGMAGWREPGRIVEMCHLVIARRSGVSIVGLKELEKSIPGVMEKVIVIDNDLYNIGSTEIRRRVAAGLSINGLVPDAVACYIQENGVYGKEV